MKFNISDRLEKITDFLRRRKIPFRLIFIITGILSTVWFLVRVIPKPTRATYPCMKAAAPWASAFVIYLIALSGSVLSVRRFFDALKKAKYPIAAIFFIGAIVFAAVTFTTLNPKAYSAPDAGSIQDSLNPIGIAKGIFPGRVVWVYNPNSTNSNFTNDEWFLDANTDQAVVDSMLDDAVLELTGAASVAEAWDSIFKFHNEFEREKGKVGYQSGEIVFIKINATSAWSGNYSYTDLSRNASNTSTYGMCETSPQMMMAVLKHLVNEVGVAQSDIYIGDPMKHIYKDIYDKLHAEFPNVHYLDHDGSYGALGREGVTQSSTDLIFYSDSGQVLRAGSLSDYTSGPPVYSDKLYTVFEDAEYLINLANMKAHARGGITMFAKNHFGSHTRDNAAHLHGGLVKPDATNPLRDDYGMYRVLTDLMTHELTGKKNVVYLMDALYTSYHENLQPVKMTKAPFNNDWTSSIFASLDPVAIESVGYDLLHYEFDGSNGYSSYPQWGAVDDYLHQAADSSLWPEGIKYDPEQDGVCIYSLGVHEHWNSDSLMEYSRNLGTGDGIELVKLFKNVGVAEPDDTTTNPDDTTSNPDYIGDIEFEGSVTAYPNPAIDNLNITMNNSYYGIVRYSIFDIHGRLYASETINKYSDNLEHKIDVSGLKFGMYFIDIRTDTGSHTIKFRKY